MWIYTDGENGHCFPRHKMVIENQKTWLGDSGIPRTLQLNDVVSNILNNITDLDPEFQKTVDENFWDLISFEDCGFLDIENEKRIKCTGTIKNIINQLDVENKKGE